MSPLTRDQDATSAIARLQAHRAAGTLARCGLLILADADEGESVARTLDSLPAELAALFAQVQVLVHGSDVAPSGLPRVPNLSVACNPRQYGFGGRRKVAFDRALAQGFEHIIVIEASTAGPLVELASLWCTAIERAGDVALGVPLRTQLGARTTALFHDMVLGRGVRHWAADARFYSVEFLRRAPFELAADDRTFDTQVLIQARALGVTPIEVPLAGWTAAPGFSATKSLRAALEYRSHQLHFVRAGHYLVDHGVRYTLKRSPSSSHAQILAAIRPGTRVLDLGCSQGLLARDLHARGVRVTGVDVLPPARVSEHLAAYHQRDLEEPLRLPEGRVYDYVLVSDVIEHVKNREQLLRSARRHLAADGRLLISTPNIAIWFYRLSLLVGRFEYGPRGVLDETHVHLFTQSTFRREVERAGFRVIAQRTTALPFEVMLESTGKSTPVAFASWSYHQLARAWPKMFAYQFLLEAEVTTLLDESLEPTAAEAGRHASKDTELPPSSRA